MRSKGLSTGDLHCKSGEGNTGHVVAIRRCSHGTEGSWGLPEQRRGHDSQHRLPRPSFNIGMAISGKVMESELTDVNCTLPMNTQALKPGGSGYGGLLYFLQPFCRSDMFK